MQNNKILSIELLRGILAITVAICHFYIINFNFFFLEIISSFCVEIFFIISGFVLCPKIIFVLQSSNIYINFKKFILKRFLRTLPSYILLLFLTSFFLNKLISFDFLSYLFFTKYLFNLNFNSDYFPIAWSLCVEEWFYILIIPFCLLLNKINKVFICKSFISKIFLWCLIFMIIKLYLIYINEFSFTELRRTTFARLDTIIFGAIVYIYRKIIFKISNLFLLTILLIFLNFFYFFNEINNYIIFKIYILSFTAAIILNIFFKKKIIKKISIISGKLSYLIYLVHTLLILIINKLYFINNINIFHQTVLYLIILIIFSQVMHNKIEKPIMNIKKYI